MSLRCTMKWKATSLSVGLLLVAAASRPSASAPRHSKPITIGMVALLAGPQKYDGKVVRTWGFLNIARTSEDDSLWLHKEDLVAALSKDSFGLELREEQ